MIDIVKKFIELYPELWAEMEAVSHNYLGDVNHPNKHHLEGNVASHTLLVMMSSFSLEGIDVDRKLQLILLLHDIGKPFSYLDKEDMLKRGFAGHAVVSKEKSIEIVDALNRELDLGILEEEKEMILTIIENHDFFIKNDIEKAIEVFDSETVYYLTLCNYCDNLGRVSASDLNVDLSKKMDLLERAIANRGD